MRKFASLETSANQTLKAKDEAHNSNVSCSETVSQEMHIYKSVVIKKMCRREHGGNCVPSVSISVSYNELRLLGDSTFT